MGCSIGPIETGAHEPFYHVYGWQLYIHFPNNDGWNVDCPASQSLIFYTKHIQDGGRNTSSRAEVSLSYWQYCEHFAGPIQVPEHGAATNSLQRLVGI